MTFCLVACGEVEVQEIHEVLAEKQRELTSYQANAKMVVYSSQQPTEYNVAISYQAPHFYRIELANASKTMQQIVIRNEQGVFLVTPHLNKTFRFQSNWPSANGQVYLYQSLLDAITKDPTGPVVKSQDGKSWTFDVKASYPQRMYARQLIRLDTTTYAPQSVEVYDEHGKKWISVHFEQFTNGTQIAADQFHVPKFTSKNEQSTIADDFQSLEPAYLPPGVEKIEERTITHDGRSAWVQRYAGAYEFSFWMLNPSRQEATVWGNQLLNVNGVFGVEKSGQTIAWWDNDKEYRLHSFNLPVSELIRIADSISVVNDKP